MNEVYRYVLLLAVNEEDLKALCAMSQFPGGLQPANTITFEPVSPLPETRPPSTLSIAPVSLPNVSVADAELKFAWYIFPENLTRDQVIASTQNSEFEQFVRNSRHFGVYSLATRT